MGKIWIIVIRNVRYYLYELCRVLFIIWCYFSTHCYQERPL